MTLSYRRGDALVFYARHARALRKGREGTARRQIRTVRGTHEMAQELRARPLPGAARYLADAAFALDRERA